MEKKKRTKMDKRDEKRILCKSTLNNQMVCASISQPVKCKRLTILNSTADEKWIFAFIDFIFRSFFDFNLAQITTQIFIPKQMCIKQPK